IGIERPFPVVAALSGVDHAAFVGAPDRPLQPQQARLPEPSCPAPRNKPPPGHTTAADSDPDTPLPHTRDATTLLYSTAYDDN
ncbi:MAG: hypothetical protein ACK524_09915, partial [Planctomyces sp.]